MAEKRTRTQSAMVTPDVDTVKAPTEQIPEVNTNEAILKKFQEYDERSRQQDETIRQLTKQIAHANGDISEDIKDSKRIYWYEIDRVTRIPEEMFEYGYRVLVHERKEKVVVKTETIGRPMVSTNFNTGKRTYTQDIEITFHDGSKVEMDNIEYITQYYTIKQQLPDSDIAVIDGKKCYTFRTEKFWTFTVPENLIN